MQKCFLMFGHWSYRLCLPEAQADGAVGCDGQKDRSLNEKVTKLIELLVNWFIDWLTEGD
jgi:hypothetical protein